MKHAMHKAKEKERRKEKISLSWVLTQVEHTMKNFDFARAEKLY